MKRPELEHVKFVLSKGHYYGYFNTGLKDRQGSPVRTSLGRFGSQRFFERYAAAQAHRTRKANPVMTMERLIDKYEESADFKRLKAGTQKFYRAHLKHVHKFFAEYPVGDVKRKHVKEVVDNRLGEHNGTRNGFLAVVGILHTYAESLDLVEGASPTKHIKKFKTGAHEPWPEHVLEAGLTAEHNRTRLAVALLYYTGMRIGDAVGLRWSDIREGWIYHTQQKTGKPMQIPVHSSLRIELDQTPRRGINILVNEHGHPMTDQVIRIELKRLAEAHGLALVPHGLRKNAVNALLQQGCSIAEVQAITGQSFRMVEHYAKQINQRAMAESAILRFEKKKDFS